MKGVLALLFLPLLAVTACDTPKKTTAHSSSSKSSSTSSSSSYKSISASAGVDDVTHKPKTVFHQGEELKIYWDLQREGSSCHNCGPVSYEIVRKTGVGERTQMVVPPTLTSDWPIKLPLDERHFPPGTYFVHAFLPNSSVSTDFSFTIN
jgi:hypothetical protein